MRRRLGTRRVCVVLIAATAIASCASLGPSPDPDPSRALTPPMTASAEQRPGPSVTITQSGIELVATLDVGSLTPGGRVRATATVTNRGLAPIRYPGTRNPPCTYNGDFWIDFLPPDIDMGHAWQGTQGDLKELLFDSYPDTLHLRAPGAPTCDAFGPPATLLPRQSLQVGESWDGRYGDGYPAQAATYMINMRFVTFQGPSDDLVPLDVTLAVDVLAAPVPLSPGHALDLGLTDPVAASWLAAHPRSTWPARPSLTYAAGSEEFRLTVQAGNGDRLQVIIHGDGRGPVEASSGVDPSFETEPPSRPA